LNELEIILSEINPQEFFGIQNINFELLKSYFPKLKIIARDNKIKAFGEKKILDKFQNKVELLSKKFSDDNFLNVEEIESILSSNIKQISGSENDKSFLIYGVKGKVIRVKSPNQSTLVKLINNNDMVFAIGPAGTGKTYTGVAMAVKALKEKLDPYMQPLYDALTDMIPAYKLKSYIEKEVIQIAPLAFMRGRTLDNAFVILDEAQNTSHSQMKMFLTRMGANAKFLITGDPGQIDLPKKTISGLKEALSILKNISGIGMVFLDESDVIRHKIVKSVINAYKKNEN
jgi:phosphate starvation-inducible PhoH-like protein